MKIGVTNLKGGVGKTTLTLNIAVCFAHMGHKVCVVDTDNNQNSMHWYGARDKDLPEVLVVGNTNPGAVTKAVRNLNLLHDYVIIDGTPNLSEINTNVMMASDLLIIPIRPGANDFRAMGEFINRLDHVRQLKPDFAVYFLINEYDDRIIAHRTVKDALKENFDIPIMDTVIKSRTVYSESALNGNGVYESGDSKAKAEIIALVTEIVALTQKHSLLKTS